MGNALSRKRSQTAQITTAPKSATSSETANTNGDIVRSEVKTEVNGSTVQTVETTSNSQDATTTKTAPVKEKKRRRFFFSLKRSRPGSVRKKKGKKDKNVSVSVDASPDSRKNGSSLFMDEFQIPEDDGIDAVSLSSNEDKKKEAESVIRRSKRGSKNGKKSKKKKQKSEKKKDEKSKKKKKGESKSEKSENVESDEGILNVNNSVEPLKDSAETATVETAPDDDNKDVADDDLVAAVTAVMDSNKLKSDDSKQGLESIVESEIVVESTEDVETAPPGSPSSNLNEDGTPKRVSLGPRLKTAILKKYSGAGDIPPDSQRVTLTKPKIVEVTDLVPPPRKNKARRALSQTKVPTSPSSDLDARTASTASSSEKQLESNVKTTESTESGALSDVEPIKSSTVSVTENSPEGTPTAESTSEFSALAGQSIKNDSTLAEKAKAVIDLVMEKSKASITELENEPSSQPESTSTSIETSTQNPHPTVTESELDVETAAASDSSKIDTPDVESEGDSFLQEVEIIVPATKVFLDDPSSPGDRIEPVVVIERIHSEPYFGPIGADISPVSEVIPERDEGVDDTEIADATPNLSERHSKETGEVCKNCLNGDDDGDKGDDAEDNSSTATSSTVIEEELAAQNDTSNEAEGVVDVHDSDKDNKNADVKDSDEDSKRCENNVSEERSADNDIPTNNVTISTVVVVGVNGCDSDNSVNENNNNKDIIASQKDITQVIIQNNSGSVDLNAKDNQIPLKNDQTLGTE